MSPTCSFFKGERKLVPRENKAPSKVSLQVQCRLRAPSEAHFREVYPRRGLEGLQTLVGRLAESEEQHAPGLRRTKGMGTSCGQLCPEGCRPEHPVLSSAFTPNHVH